MEHTPGPWKAQSWLITADRKTNSRCGAIASIVTTATMYEDKWDANARLIAAAPDLLEALKGTVQALYSANGFSEKKLFNSSPYCLKMVEDAEQAINKARVD